MGTICPPSYTNTLINHFERKRIYPLIEGKSLTYFRYIDHIFLIWTGTKNELDQFFRDLNKKHTSLKFDYKALKNRVAFLYTEIYLPNVKLHTKIYREETGRQNYCHIKSEHPKSFKYSLSYSQAIRFKRIGSDQVNLNNSLTEMKNSSSVESFSSFSQLSFHQIQVF